jgi:3-oxoacyl-[acyl-carrier-protein] synthase II
LVKHAVVITGIGAVSSLGCGADALWEGCLTDQVVAEPVPASWSVYYRAASRNWAPLPAIDFRAQGFSRQELLVMGMPSVLALCAAQEAWRQAALPTAPMKGNDSWRSGVYLGTGLGGAKAPFDNYRAHLLSGLKPHLENALSAAPDDARLSEHLAALKLHPRVHPLVICQTMPNAATATLSMAFGFRGAAETLCHACASGTVAIGRAYEAIQRGELSLALAGGVEHLRDNAGGVFMGFDRLQTLARPLASGEPENRPFDRKRSGFLFSEGGAGMVVLESAEHAQARGAKVLAEVRAFGANADAHSMVALDEEGRAISRLYTEVLDSAGLGCADIDYINAHGTGTELNDAVESKLLERYFGPTPLVNSTKSVLGHSIGASGALEVVVTVKSLLTQQVHASRNLDDPIADLNFCRQSGSAQINHALTESFGFGGHNAVLILGRAPESH